MSQADGSFQTRLRRRHRWGRIFEAICLVSTWFGLLVLVVLLAGVIWQASGWLDWEFLSNFDSPRRPEQAGLLAGIWGSLWLILFTMLFSIPLGVGAAVYLEEYATDNWLTRLIQVNLSNLAGVPSIVYGILGLTVFVRTFGVFRGEPRITGLEISPWIFEWLGFPLLIEVPLPLGRTLMAGALTLTLLILPIVIVAAREALRAVPPSVRHASYALGATQWQTIRHQVLPASLPGIMTGVILAISRAVGETAPLLLIGALTFVPFAPGGINSPADIVSNPEGVLRAPFDSFTTITIMIFNWVLRPQAEYQHVAAAGILVLLVVLLLLNAVAIFIRHRYQKWMRW